MSIKKVSSINFDFMFQATNRNPIIKDFAAIMKNNAKITISIIVCFDI